MVFTVSTNVYTRTHSQSKQYIKSDVLPEVLFFYYVRSYVCTDTVIFISTLSRTCVLYINKENACMCRQLLRLLRSPVIHEVHK
jgi:hypothetical protein